MGGGGGHTEPAVVHITHAFKNCLCFHFVFFFHSLHKLHGRIKNYTCLPPKILDFLSKFTRPTANKKLHAFTLEKLYDLMIFWYKGYVSHLQHNLAIGKKQCTCMHPTANSKHDISSANKYSRSGTPPCGRFHCNPYPNIIRRIRIHQSGTFTPTHKHQHQRKTMGNQPTADFRIYSGAVPKFVLSNIAARAAMAAKTRHSQKFHPKNTKVGAIAQK